MPPPINAKIESKTSHHDSAFLFAGDKINDVGSPLRVYYLRHLRLVSGM